jgi:hypothetical protein
MSRLGKHSLLPQVGSQVGVGLSNGCICNLRKVAKGSSTHSSRGVTVLNARNDQKLPGDGKTIMIYIVQSLQINITFL